MSGRRKLQQFAKAKNLPCPARVTGKLRRVYLDPTRVRVFRGKEIRGESNG